MKRSSLSLRFSIEQGLEILDQSQLPQTERWLPIHSPELMVEAIKELRVRGAPLIGISASLFWAHWLQSQTDVKAITQCYQSLRHSRPTAINLMNNLDSCYQAWLQGGASAALAQAIRLFDEDILLCEQMADWGSSLIQSGERILTYCNTGALATAGTGTALGVIKKAHQQGKSIHVYVCETRPLGQGARLSTWELARHDIPYQLILDNTAAFLMQQKRISKIFVGADRITKNMDIANKIGTYNLAVLAQYHQIPFYVVAPMTTFDTQCETGTEIPIEERPAQEILACWQRPPEKTASSTAFAHPAFSSQQESNSLWLPEVYNPAFDITPHKLITAIVTEKGIMLPPSPR